ncbi:MAG TPA: hypothetical protein VM661_06170 [Candidatus Sulfotelmatobacter sp.]|jgi:hypothetical protein|nr:hypothetical protein [Candidatus Sulfotelmatobacter sp.]
MTTQTQIDQDFGPDYVSPYLRALWELEDAGPHAPLSQLEEIYTRLPPGHFDTRLLRGFLDGRKADAPGGPEWAAEMHDGCYAEGWWWGRCG